MTTTTPRAADVADFRSFFDCGGYEAMVPDCIIICQQHDGCRDDGYDGAERATDLIFDSDLILI